MTGHVGEGRSKRPAKMEKDAEGSALHRLRAAEGFLISGFQVRVSAPYGTGTGQDTVAPPRHYTPRQTMG